MQAVYFGLCQLRWHKPFTSFQRILKEHTGTFNRWCHLKGPLFRVPPANFRLTQGRKSCRDSITERAECFQYIEPEAQANHSEEIGLEKVVATDLQKTNEVDMNSRRFTYSSLATIAFFAQAVAHAQTPLMRQLAQEDQDSRTGKTIARTDDERRKIVLEFIGKGELKGPEDKFDAALVLQHTSMDFCDKRLVSKSADNYLIAHYLFVSAYEGGIKEARYLIAASLDRYLSMTEGYQKYGTNREFNQETRKEELVPIDRNTPDSERAKYGVPPLAELLKQYPEQALKKRTP